MKQIIFIATFFILFQSCTTIDIAEKDAFDVKQTINRDFFDGHPYDFQMHTIATTDGKSLEAWHFTRDRNTKTVLYLGGNGFLMQMARHIIPPLLENNVNLLAFNYRGYGNSSGEPSIRGIKQDGMAVYGYLIDELGEKPSDIIIHGHSLGTMVATWLAVEKPAAGLVLESPVTDAPDMVDKLVPWFLSLFVKFDIAAELKTDSNLERIEKVNVPLFLVVGEKDKITPPSLAEVLYEKAQIQNKQLKVIENGDHNDLPGREVFKEAMTSFFDSLGAKTAVSGSLE